MEESVYTNLMRTLSLGENRVEKGNIDTIRNALRHALEQISKTSVPVISKVARHVHRQIRRNEIMSHFNTVSDFDHEDMPNDLENACTLNGIRDNGQTLEALSNLFISQWFDKDLNGREGLLHGADIMFTIGPMVAKMLQEGEKVQEIENVRFHLPVTNQLEIHVFEENTYIDHLINGRKPAITATINTDERKICVVAFETDIPIARRAASNTFVKTICAEPLADAIIDEKPPTAGIRLNKLSRKDQHFYDKLRKKNHVGIVSTTLLDIVITAATALAHAGHIPNERPLGGGFQNFVFSKPLQITKGCVFAFTKIGKPKTTSSGAMIYPLHFIFEGPLEEEVATGIFNWVSRPCN